MAQVKVFKARLYGAKPTVKNPDVFRLAVAPQQFLDIPVRTYNAVMNGELVAVVYDDETKPLEVKDSEGNITPIQFHQVIDAEESLAAKIARANKEIEIIEAFDQAKYDAAKKKAEGLVL